MSLKRKTVKTATLQTNQLLERIGTVFQKFGLLGMKALKKLMNGRTIELPPLQQNLLLVGDIEPEVLPKTRHTTTATPVALPLTTFSALQFRTFLSQPSLDSACFRLTIRN